MSAHLQLINDDIGGPEGTERERDLLNLIEQTGVPGQKLIVPDLLGVKRETSKKREGLSPLT